MPTKNSELKAHLRKICLSEHERPKVQSFPGTSLKQHTANWLCIPCILRIRSIQWVLCRRLARADLLEDINRLQSWSKKILWCNQAKHGCLSSNRFGFKFQQDHFHHFITSSLHHFITSSLHHFIVEPKGINQM